MTQTGQISNSREGKRREDGHWVENNICLPETLNKDLLNEQVRAAL